VYLLFPFEKNFYDKFNVSNEFVGHPLLEDLQPELFNKDHILFSRQKYGITKAETVLALMPGSRKGEVEHNFSVMLEVAQNLLKKYQNLRVVILVAPTLEQNYIQDFMQEKCSFFRSPFILIKDDPAKMVALTDLVLVASGTATLLVGLLHKPMVIMYKVKWLTALLGRWLVRGIKYFGLINLVMDEEVVPERLQEHANAQELTQLLEKYLVDENYRLSVEQRLTQAQIKLGNGEKNNGYATEKVATSLMKYL
jgi:lipid-A-disaccharide synthase